MSQMRLQVLVDLVDRITGPAGAIQRSLHGIERAAHQADLAMNRLQTGAVIAAAGIAAAAPLVLATNAAIGFETAMADVRKVVDFTPEYPPERLTAQLVNLSREIPISAAGLTNITAAAGQAGVEISNLTRFTEQAARVSTAFDMTTQQSGDVLARLSTVYEQNLDYVFQLSDAVNHLSNRMASTAPDILEVLSRVGSLGRQAGMSGEQVAALGSAMLSTGAAPQIVSTSLNAMIRILSTATLGEKRFQQGLEELGFTAEGLEQSMQRNAVGTIMNVLQAANQAQSPVRALSQLFGAEYGPSVSRLAGNLGLVRQALGYVSDTTQFAGSVQQEFITRSATTANQMQLLRNDLAAIGITIGNYFLPPLRAVVGWLRSGADAVLNLAQQYPGLTQGIGFAVAALSLLVIGAGGLVMALGALGFATSYASIGVLTLRQTFEVALLRAWDLAGALDRLIARFWALGGPLGAARAGVLALAGAFRVLTLAMLKNPVVLIATAVIALGAAFVWAWNRVAQFRDQVWQALFPLILGWNNFRAAIAGLAAQFGPVGEFIAAGLGRAQLALGDLAYVYGFVLGFLFTFTIGVFARIGAAILQSLIGWVIIVRGLLEVIVGLFTGNFDRARAGVSVIMEGVLQVITAPLRVLGQDAVDWGRNIMIGLATGIADGLAWVRAKITEGAEAIKGWFSNLMKFGSPSRVFAGYGLMLSLGLAQGIESGLPHVADAVAAMAIEPQMQIAQPLAVPAPPQAQRAARQAPQVHITIENIHIGAGQSPQQVVEGLQSALREAVLLAFEEAAVEEGYGPNS